MQIEFFLFSFHLCTKSSHLSSHCGVDSGAPLLMIDRQNGERYVNKCGSCVSFVFVIRYTQTAVASYGPKRHSECGQKPGGFTRLTPEVLNWVKTVTGMEYHAGINDPGLMLIVQPHCLQ